MKKTITSLFLMVFLLSFTSAWGVSNFYSSGLEMSPGDSLEIDLILQNEAPGATDLTIRTDISNDGNGIAALTDGTQDIFVSAGTHWLDVPITVSIPSDITTNQTRIFTTRFREVTEQSDGTIIIGLGYSITIAVDIIVYEVADKKYHDLDEINDAKEAIDEASDAINEADTGKRKRLATKQLALAKKQLKLAERLYDKDKVKASKALAKNAKRAAERAEKILTLPLKKLKNFA